jgi:hypothetical protein
VFNVEKAVPFVSEEIEPFAAKVIGRMWARVEFAKKNGMKSDVYDACNRFWHALGGLEKLAVSIGSATHFSVSMNNHIMGSAKMIEKEIGINPMDKNLGPAWEW